MKSCGTYDDVNLILRLYDMRRETKLREARAWFVKNYWVKTLEESVRLCPPGSEENAYFRMVTTYWDMAASFIAGGVLHKELFFESNRELLLVWERVKPVIPAIREAYKDPRYLGNIEVVAADYVEWVKGRGPQAYEAFVQRVATPPKA